MTLHLYAQEQWHDSAYIVGTKEDLLKLQVAITNAIHQGKATPGFFVNDGEGFDIVIRVVDEITAGRLAVPYTSDIAREHEGTARVLPWALRFDPPKIDSPEP